MEISSNITQNNSLFSSKNLKTVFTQKLSSDEVKELKAQIDESVNAYSFQSVSTQSYISSKGNDFNKSYEDFQSFLNDVGYKGKPIAELSKEEAGKLVSEDGLFGIKQTSERIANFVINGSGGDESRLRAGREGMLQGFKDAENLWGGKLPDISQQTMQKAIEMVDKTMQELGFSVLNQEA